MIGRMIGRDGGADGDGAARTDPQPEAMRAALAAGHPALALAALAETAADLRRRSVGQGWGTFLGLDAAVAALLEAARPLLPPVAPRPGLGGAVWIVTEIYPAGGHRTLLEQTLRAHRARDERAEVLFTRLLDHRPAFSLARMADLGVAAAAPPRGWTLWDKWLWLRAELAARAPGVLGLAAHSEDAIAALVAAEWAAGMGRRLVILRHADTLPALGVDHAGATHLAIRPEQAAAIRAALPGAAVALVPLTAGDGAPPVRLVAEPAPAFGRPGAPVGRLRAAAAALREGPRAAARAALWAARRAAHAARARLAPLRGRSPRVTATCGTEHKFALDGPLALPAVLAAVLRATKGRHVHVGPASAAFRRAVRAGLRAEGIAPGRVAFAGEVPSVAAALRWHGAGVYLGSFPVAGALSLLEAAAAGLAIALREAPGDGAARYLAGSDLGPPQAIRWQDAAGLAAALADLAAADAARLGASARAWHAARGGAGGFAAALSAVLGALPPLAGPTAAAPAAHLPLRPAGNPSPAAPAPHLPLRPAGNPSPAAAGALEAPLASAAPPGARLLALAAPVTLARPRIAAERRIAPPPRLATAPAVAAAAFERARAFGGADGVLTLAGEWFDPLLADFDPCRMALRRPNAVASLPAPGRVRLMLPPAAADLQLAEAILGCGSYSHNYFHFLLEVLPRAVAAAALAPPGTPVLTEADLPVQHYEALRLVLPGNPVRTLPRGAGAAVGRLWAATAGSLVHDSFPGDGDHPAAAIRYHPATLALWRGVAAALRGGAPGGAAPESGAAESGAAESGAAGSGAAESGAAESGAAARLWLTRDGRVRRLTNRAQLRQALEARGFASLAPDRMPFAAQVRALAGAGTIVGQSGAGLANLLFAPPGAEVFVLMSDAPGTNHRLWSALGEALGLGVTVVVGAHEGRRLARGLDPVHADHAVPVARLTALLDADRPAAPPPADALGLADALCALAEGADAVTGAWAARAAPLPPALGARAAALARAFPDAVAAADPASLRALMRHPLVRAPGRVLRVIALHRDAPGAAAEAAGAALAALALPDAALPPAETLRRHLLVALVALPGWRVPLPVRAAALPDDVLALWFDWAAVEPGIARAADDDAAWTAHAIRFCDWIADALAPGTPAAHRARIAARARALDLGLFLLLDAPPAPLLAARARMLAALAPPPPPPPRAAPRRGARPRVGILCQSLARGPDAIAVLALAEALAPGIEVVAYTAAAAALADRVAARDAARDAAFAARLAGAIPLRRALPPDDAGIAAMLAADAPDLLLHANATGLGAGPLDRALVHRVARVQAGLNCQLPLPPGLPAFDAFLTPATAGLDPAACPGRLVATGGPGSAVPGAPPPPAAPPPLTRAMLGIAPAAPVLFSAAAAPWLRPACLDAMLRAAAGVPDAVLLLAPWHPLWAGRALAVPFCAAVERAAAAAGLPRRRLVILGELSVSEAEAALALSDIYLGSFPHGDAAMTSRALAMGVPPVLRARRCPRSIDEFLVRAAGGDDLIAPDIAGYVARAQALARDAAARRALGARLAAAIAAGGGDGDGNWNRAHAAALAGAVRALLEEAR